MIGLNVFLLALLTVASLALACVEAAFYLTKRRRLGHLSLQNPRAELVNRYLEDPPTLLMPVHMGTYTAHVGITVLLTSMLLDRLQRWAILVAFLVMVGYLLLVRLSVPYALVRRHPERLLLLLLPPFHLYAQTLAPLVRWLRQRSKPEPAEPEEQPGAPPVSEVPPPPVLDPDDARLSESLARFSEAVVRDVMTPRPDIVALAAAASIAELRRLMRESKYSRLPVFGENLDDIVGVVSVRDLLEYDGDDALPVQTLMRPAFLVPETRKIAELLRDMQAQRTLFAIVIDEYGGTAGLVTVEDIVEELVGEIKDEYDIEAEPIAVEEDGALLVAGRVNVDRLEQALETPLTDGEGVGTVGGLVASVFGRIPKVGERMDYRGFTLEVVDAEHKRVNSVRVRRKPVEVEA
jgi:CBS domain containing-hemolysin-like protein